MTPWRRPCADEECELLLLEPKTTLNTGTQAESVRPACQRAPRVRCARARASDFRASYAFPTILSLYDPLPARPTQSDFTVRELGSVV